MDGTGCGMRTGGAFRAIIRVQFVSVVAVGVGDSRDGRVVDAVELTERGQKD